MKIQILAWETFIPYPRIANKTPAFYKKYEGLQVAEYSNFVRSNEIFASKSGLLGKKVTVYQSGTLIKSGILFVQIQHVQNQQLHFSNTTLKTHFHTGFTTLKITLLCNTSRYLLCIQMYPLYGP